MLSHFRKLPAGPVFRRTSRSSTPILVAAGLLCGLPFSCTSPELGAECSSLGADQDPACVRQTITQSVALTDQRDVDILFVIDNSPSMSPKQRALAENIPRFMQAIEAQNLNYHVGIVTTDVGTLPSDGTLFPTTAGSCSTVSGDDGVLQNLPCTARGLSGAALVACQALCPDDRFVPQGGARFISKQGGVTNVPSDTVVDPKTGARVDRGPENAFKCMALVGDRGCGVEAPLEAAKRALDQHRADNDGFLRTYSTLALIFITDEDDCSVQAGNRARWNNPQTMDCGANASDPGCYRIDYRCIADSVICDQPMSTPGPKTGCKAKPTTYLESIDRYARFVQTKHPYGPVIVGGIWTLPSVLAGGKLQVAQAGVGTPGLSLATDGNASCVYSRDPSIVGQAQHRLSSFADRFGTDALQVSVCDIDQYPVALAQLGAKVTAGQGLCLRQAPRRTDGQPQCVVGEIDASTPTAAPDVALPVCSSTCCDGVGRSRTGRPDEAVIQTACAAEITEACYCLAPSVASDSSCSGGWLGSVWRKGGVALPQGKLLSFRCAVE